MRFKDIIITIVINVKLVITVVINIYIKRVVKPVGINKKKQLSV